MAFERVARKILVGLLLAAALFATLAASFPAAGMPGTSANPPAQVQPGNELQDFGLVSASTGWVQWNGRLYWTADAGAQWREITPPFPSAARLLSVTFLDARTGRVLWSVPDSNDSLILQLSSTSDGGATWASSIVQTFLSSDLDSSIESATMDWLDASTGWVSLTRQTGAAFSAGSLFHTTNGGASWVRSALPAGGAVRFVNGQVGWMAGGPASDRLFKTTDAGLTWQEQPLPAGTEAGQLRLIQPPIFSSPENGSLAAILQQADAYQLQISSTTNGGLDWQPVATVPLNSQNSSIPLSLLGPRNWVAILPGENRLARMVDGTLDTRLNADGQSAGIVDQKMISMEAGWARWDQSNCVKQASAASPGTTEINCTASQKLLETRDGGATWQTLPLPGVRAAMFSQNSSLTTTQLAQVSAAGTTNTQVFIGKGFDICGVPPLATMDVWDDYSPYATMNLYIGGSMLYDGCYRSFMNSSYVSTAYSYGWTFIPTWVGPQAPCTSYLSRISSNVNQAYLDGVNEANLAMEALLALGLTTANKSSSIVYYDLETFVGDQACRDAVKSFMDGWDYQLKLFGNKSGIYGSTGCTNGLNNYLSIPNKPDAIWAALWDDRATVWGLNCISDSVWTSHQRIHQYQGAHNETYGPAGAPKTLNIDTDMLDGIVAIPNQTVVTPVPPPSAVFTAAPTSGTGPLTVTFSITNVLNISSCSWVYGDGQTDTRCSPHTHVYNNSGSYSVTLTVYGPGGWDDLTRANYITVTEPSQPDLIPYPRLSAADPIIISSLTGMSVNDTLFAGQSVFIDWGFKNIGTTNINNGFKVYLYIDDQRILASSYTSLGAGATNGASDTSTIWNTSGWHTAKIVVDPENTVAESNEGNNIWSKQFYWEESPPIGPVIISPAQMDVVNTNLPVFQWHPPASTYVSSYIIYLNALPPGVLVLSSSVPVSKCQNSVCSFRSISPLSQGDYQFKVGALDIYGVWTYSPWTIFSYTPNPPAAPANLAPSGTITIPSPTFSWTKSIYTSWYELYIYPAGSSTAIVSAASIKPLTACVDTTCSFTPPPVLDRGDYTIKVRAINPAGASNYTTASFYMDVDISKVYLPLIIR